MYPLLGSPIVYAFDSPHFVCFSDGPRYSELLLYYFGFSPEFREFLLDKQAIGRYDSVMM